MDRKYRIKDFSELPGLKEINKECYTEMKWVGFRCFLRCSSCRLNIYLHDMKRHWEKKHYKVVCTLCKLVVDHHVYHQHVSKECSGRVVYCRYCSCETMLGHLNKHEAECEYSPEVQGGKIDFIGMPKNIRTKLPYFNQVCKTAEVYSKVHRKEADPSVAFDSSQKLQKKYPDQLRNKPFGNGDTQFEFDEELLGKQMIHKRETAMASKAMEQYMRLDRVGIRYPTPIKPNSSSPSGTGATKGVHFSNPVSSACTSGSTRNTPVDQFGLLKPKDSALATSKNTKLDPKGLWDSMIKNHGGTSPNTGQEELYKYWKKTGEEARMKCWEAQERAKYTDNVRAAYSVKNREMANAYAAKVYHACVAKSAQSLSLAIEAAEFERSKTNVINQAVQLEKSADKLKMIPQDSWADFVNDVKKTRKIWPDLGFEAEDCVSADEEIEALTKKGEKIIKQLNNPEHYFTTIDTSLSAEERQKGGSFVKCEICNEFILVKLMELHTKLCLEDQDSKAAAAPSDSVNPGRKVLYDSDAR